MIANDFSGDLCWDDLENCPNCDESKEDCNCWWCEGCEGFTIKECAIHTVWPVDWAPNGALLL